MLYFSRSVTIVGVPLAAAVLLACLSPAGARVTANRILANGTSLNRITLNGIWQNGVSAAGRITTGSALGDLNGIAVEAVILPDAATR